MTEDGELNAELGMRNAENKKKRRPYACDLILFVVVLVNKNFIGDDDNEVCTL